MLRRSQNTNILLDKAIDANNKAATMVAGFFLLLPIPATFLLLGIPMTQYSRSEADEHDEHSSSDTGSLNWFSKTAATEVAVPPSVVITLSARQRSMLVFLRWPILSITERLWTRSLGHE